jgi:adenine-specific DNA-methyltransferase
MPVEKKKPIEQYEHKDKERVNNPPVGLVTSDTDKETAEKKTYSYDPHLDPSLQFDSQRSQIEKIIDNGMTAQTLEDAKTALSELKKRQSPYLNWAGKAEHTSFEVPTVSLHVHERIDPRTIIEAVRKRNGHNYEQMSLFNVSKENPPLREAVEFYKHQHNWSNRMIAGDSLLVMNSLIEKEGMAGKVQMVYIDPPYGIKYGSNFQPFVNKREVKDGKDEDLTAEPEMIKAFRDTWELGIHSYLTYLRDRLLLAKELLTESGSVFVQISDENVHLVRSIMDEIFGKKNFCNQITFQKTGSIASKGLGSTVDYLIWYAKDKASLKYWQLFSERKQGDTTLDRYDYVELTDGQLAKIPAAAIRGEEPIPEGKRCRLTTLLSDGESQEQKVFIYEGETFSIRHGKHWKTNPDTGGQNLVKRGRIIKQGETLWYKRFVDDFPVVPVSDRWESLQIGQELNYVVQTSSMVIQRCVLMTTDAGDLVFDPTCGSGTTAYVAEQWGRRWVTCDTSRVAITLAKQRLMTALYDYYELAHADEGIGSGLKYKTVPHITLKSIANNEPAGQETLYDQPKIDNSKARVSGPFTVEAVPAPVVKPLEEIKNDLPADESVARSGETLRQSEWRDELLRTGIRGKNGQYIMFSRVESIPGRWLHADAETKPNDAGADSVKEKRPVFGEPQRAVISFGPEHAPLEQRQVENAIGEARKLVPQPKLIVFAAFQFDPEAAKDIDETDWPGLTLLKAQMNADMQTADLKKKRASNDSYWLVGQPDVKVEKQKDGKYTVEVLGFDYYNTKTGTVESGGTANIAMWLLDTDYDGRSLFPKQVFFPLAGEKEGWARLAKNLKAEIDPELIEAYRGTVSLPFAPGGNKSIAVKIVDDRGIESLKLIEVA